MIWKMVHLDRQCDEFLMISSESNHINFHLAKCSLKEAKKVFCEHSNLYIIDIPKIIKELGYDLDTLTPESEFVIDYSIKKKITQGIYSTRSNEILITYKNIGDSFVKNLNDFLDNEFQSDDFVFSVNWTTIKK